MIERTIMEAVVWADLVICQIGAMPWGKIALSVALAAVFIKAVKYL